MEKEELTREDLLDMIAQLEFEVKILQKRIDMIKEFYEE